MGVAMADAAGRRGRRRNPSHSLPRSSRMPILFAVTMGFALLHIVTVTSAGESPPSVASPAATFHTIFSTECTTYFDWQSVGLVYSHQKVSHGCGLRWPAACLPRFPRRSKVLPRLSLAPSPLAPPAPRRPG